MSKLILLNTFIAVYNSHSLVSLCRNIETLDFIAQEVHSEEAS